MLTNEGKFDEAQALFDEHNKAMMDKTKINLQFDIPPAQVILKTSVIDIAKFKEVTKKAKVKNAYLLTRERFCDRKKED